MTRALLSALLMFTLQAPQLDTVTASGAKISGVGAPYSQQPVKGQNVVKGVKGASCQCGQGAVVKGKK